MAVVMPFKGLRYNPAKVDDLSLVVTPPYDVISSEEQEKYYDKHPYNIIRLEYGKQFAEDSESNNRYTRAAETLQKWLEEKILLPEDKPVMYRYQQLYQIKGEEKVRTGLICNVKIEPYEKGVILPHEETMPKHKKYRLALMQACAANISPLFGLYADYGKTVDKILEDISNEKQLCEFVDEQGITHRLHIIDNPQTISQIQEAMERLNIFIADGHHRYETALKYRDLRREELGLTGEPGDQPFDYVMFVLVNLYDPGLVILPTHRLVKNIERFKLKKFIKKLAEDFRVEEFAVDPNGSNIKEFLDLIYRRGGLDVGSGTFHFNAFGLYAGNGQGYAITLDSENTLDRLVGRSEHRSLAWQGLDVTVLQTTILERLLGISGEDLANQTKLAYTHDETEALKAVDSGEYQMAFLMNPTQVDELTAIAIGGEKMPQKSTYFYPKLITGLVINKF